MNADIMAEWFRRQGYTVVRTESSYWYDAGLRVFQAFPYHWLIEPTEKELDRLFFDKAALALRFSTQLNASQGKISYHVVCRDPGFALSSLPRQARQNVQRGLAYARIEKIPIQQLATEGWRLRQDTLERQGRSRAENREWWHRMCMSAEGLPGFESLAAVRGDELVAAFLAFKCDDWYILPYEQSSSAHIDSRVNHSLFFTVTQNAFKDPGTSSVFFGLESLDAPPTIDDFKLRMGFQAYAVRQRVAFHPYLRLAANNTTHHLVKLLKGRNPSRYTLAKAEGILRFYLEGKQPLQSQTWPNALVHTERHK
jgi:hypothetical protein